MSRRTHSQLRRGNDFAGFLAACSAEAANPRATKAGSPVDTTKQAKRDGILNDSSYADPPALSPADGD
jgi:hypothetical protein